MTTLGVGWWLGMAGTRGPSLGAVRAMASLACGPSLPGMDRSFVLARFGTAGRSSRGAVGIGAVLTERAIAATMQRP